MRCCSHVSVLTFFLPTPIAVPNLPFNLDHSLRLKICRHCYCDNALPESKTKSSPLNTFQVVAVVQSLIVTPMFNSDGVPLTDLQDYQDWHTVWGRRELDLSTRELPLTIHTEQEYRTAQLPKDRREECRQRPSLFVFCLLFIHNSKLSRRT